MADKLEVAEKIRGVLEEEMPGEPERVDRAVQRILEIVDPFEKAAREELDRYRRTFAELAK